MKNALAASGLLVLGLLSGCATEESRTLEVAKVQSYQSSYSGARQPISVGKFDNRSSYMRGLFSDGVDRLGDGVVSGTVRLGGGDDCRQHQQKCWNEHLDG